MLQYGWPSKSCQLKKSNTEDLKLYFICVFISGQGKFIETDHCGSLGVAAAVNRRGAGGELSWADGNVLKSDWDDGYTPLNLLKLENCTQNGWILWCANYISTKPHF